MICLHPLYVREWQGEEGNKLKTNSYHLVPCGKCVACLSQRRSTWTYRLQKERSASSYSFFLTLTYDNDKIPIRIVENKPFFVFNKKHVQDYLKRVRFIINKMNPKLVLRYYCVSEYGSKTHRPHYHMQLFVQNDNSLQYMRTITQTLEKEWPFGYFQRKPTDDANIHYVTKYCIKGLEQLPDDCIDPVFILASKRPYLGEYAESLIERQGDGAMNKVFLNGVPMPTPRIYRQKIGIPAEPRSPNSPDPRLSSSCYDELMKEYRRTHNSFSLKDFTIFCNNRLNRFESDAIRRQQTRNEKL